MARPPTTTAERGRLSPVASEEKRVERRRKEKERRGARHGGRLHAERLQIRHEVAPRPRQEAKQAIQAGPRLPEERRGEERDARHEGNEREESRVGEARREVEAARVEESAYGPHEHRAREGGDLVELPAG